MSFPYKLPLLLDGATGTQLQKLGMPGGACTETWVLEHPEVLTQLQEAYVQAGSDVVYAPTFGTNRVNLKKHGVTQSVAELCARQVELTQKIVDGRCLIGADMAPTGLMLEPYGEATEEDLVEIFTEQAKAIDETDADLIGIMTQMYADEALAAVRAVRAVSQKPLLVSFSCGPTGKTLWGEDLCDILEEMQDMGIDAFGINCSGELGVVTRVLGELKQVAKVPLIAKPNAGTPRSVGGKTVYDMTPEELAAAVPALTENGAQILGGCCGTDERHIAAIKAAVVKHS
jgi:5-methyltetrahydrofolate--homocysteine methyltransferase